MNKNRPATCFINRAEVTPFAKSRVPPITGNDMNSDGVVTSVHGNDPSNCGLDYLFHSIDIDIMKKLQTHKAVVIWIALLHKSSSCERKKPLGAM